MGPYPAAKATYVERSPIHAADKIKAPVILFQVGFWQHARFVCVRV